MFAVILLTAILIWFIGLWYLLSIQSQRKFEQVYKPSPFPKEEPISFVPMEARIVPTHANYSNKFNDVIGNQDSGLMVEGVPEVVIPSDWYMSRTLPTEFDGRYWPAGTTKPDFIFPGSTPVRPLRKQTWPAAYTSLPGA